MPRVRELEVRRGKAAKQGRGLESREGADILDKVPKKSSWRRKHISKDLKERKGEAV